MRSHTESIAVQAPFAGRKLQAFFAHRAVAGVELVDGSSYRRTVALAGGAGAIRIDLRDLDANDPDPKVVTTVWVTDPADVNEALTTGRRLIDADADPRAIDETLAADPALAPSVRSTPGIRVPGAVDGAEILFRALWGQQVSVAAARTALGRLTEQLGTPLPNPVDGLTHVFPTAAAIAELGADGIAGPRRRAETIAAVAHDLTNGRLDLSPDRGVDAVTADLVSRSGIGPWTAGYLAMRWLGDRDVLLSGDLVLRQGAATVGVPASPAALSAHSRRWQPYRSYAGLHLWGSQPAAGRRARGG